MPSTLLAEPSRSTIFSAEMRERQDRQEDYLIAEERILVKNGNKLVIAGKVKPELMGRSFFFIEVHDKRRGQVRGYRISMNTSFRLWQMNDGDAQKLGFHNASAALEHLKRKSPKQLHPYTMVSLVATYAAFTFDKNNRPEFIQDILARKANTR